MASERPERNGNLNSGSTDGMNGSAQSARSRSRSEAGSAHGESASAQRQAKQATDAIESLALEATLDELDRITAALEESHRPLEESLALYERGVRLVQHSQELLDSADLRLQRLRPASGDDYDARSDFALDDFALDEE